jgi:predicted DNA-binding transcriptional regulator YafY
MPLISGKKAYSLCILQILRDYSDSDHPLTYKDIIKKLQQEYGIDASRNAVGQNIALLRDMGFDISNYEENRKGNYLASREFDDMELRVLIDSVLISKYIPANYAKHLIEKLEALSNIYFRSRMKHLYTLHEGRHQRNREFFFSFSVIDEAITLSQQIAFFYNRISTDKELTPVRKAKDVVNPYAIVCANGQYYLIASFRKWERLLHYRLDRITQIEILDKPARAIIFIPGYENGFNIAQYTAEHNFMYGGKTEQIVLKMNKRFVGDVIDTFGYEVNIKDLDDDFMEVRLKAAIEGVRFFALQYGPNCEVLEPKELREMVRADIIEMIKKYEL